MFSIVILKRKFKKAQKYMEKGEYDKSFKLFNDVIKSDYRLSDSYFYLGQILFEKEDFEKALFILIRHYHLMKIM